MNTRYIHLTDAERRRMERLRKSGKGVRAIARALDRGVGTVSEELRRNSVRGAYDARKAGHKAYVRRKYAKADCLAVVGDRELRRYVEDKLAAEWSPEAIAGRIRRIDRRLPRASTKAIYKFVYSPHGRPLEHCLYSRAVRRKSGPKRNRPVWEDGRRSIEERPREVGKRRQFGHFEADFIESGRDGTGSVLVLVERRTRYPFLRYVADRGTEAVNRLVMDALAGIPARSITVDNDLSLQKHRQLSELLHADVFFCHPQSPHEKGTVENRNKVIRRYLPKRSDLSQYRDRLPGIEEKLRSRPMKCLGWRTPAEAWGRERETRETKNHGECVVQWSKAYGSIGESVRLRG